MLTRLERKVLHTKGVKVSIDEANQLVSFEKNGQTLKYAYKADLLKPSLADDVLSFEALDLTPEHAMHLGTAISISGAHIQGLNQPFKIELELKGTGFKAALKTEKDLASLEGVNRKGFMKVKQASSEKDRPVLVLTLGKSHDDYFIVPSDVTVTLGSAIQMTVESANKHSLGQAVAKIRRFRKVDAYKGKGVLLKGMVLSLKETKKKK